MQSGLFFTPLTRHWPFAVSFIMAFFHLGHAPLVRLAVRTSLLADQVGQRVLVDARGHTDFQCMEKAGLVFL
jgi:hypothetical protein